MKKVALALFLTLAIVGCDYDTTVYKITVPMGDGNEVYKAVWVFSNDDGGIRFTDIKTGEQLTIGGTYKKEQVGSISTKDIPMK